MEIEFIYYESDESFDYGDFPGGTYAYFEPHGFKVEIDKNDNVLINTLVGLGDFYSEIKKIKTIDEFLKFLFENEKYITNPDDMAVYQEIIEFTKGTVL